MKLSPSQLETLIALIQETRMVEFFEKTDQYGLKTLEISLFRKEFIAGKYGFDFYERLEAYVRSLANPQETENSNKTQNPTNMKTQNSSKIENGNDNTVIQGVKNSEIIFGNKKIGNSEWLIAFVVLVFVVGILFGIKMFLDFQKENNTQNPEKEQISKPSETKKDTVFVEKPKKEIQKSSKETYFTVTLKDGNGKILGTRQVKKGASLQTFSVEGYKESDPYLIEKDTKITLETN